MARRSTIHLVRIGVHRVFLLACFFVLTFLGTCPAGDAQRSDPIVLMHTSKGTIVMRIFINYAPNTASRFLNLVNSGFYNGLTFHRVENWVIQGGCPNGNGTGILLDPSGRPSYVPLELSGLRHNSPGVIAMAHSKSPNSNSCQFYITKRAMPALDGSYSIFGGVIQGMDAVYNMSIGDRILSAEIANTGGGGQGAQRRSSPPPPSGDSGF